MTETSICKQKIKVCLSAIQQHGEQLWKSKQAHMSHWTLKTVKGLMKHF